MHGSRLTNHLVTEAVGLFSACIFRNVNLGESCDPAGLLPLGHQRRPCLRNG